MKLYIVRHGETDWNRENRRQGWLNSNLSEKGVIDTKLLAESLKDINFKCIYCSPLGRAVETATLLKGSRNIPMVVCDNLKEINFGVWEGMLNDEINVLYEEENFNFWHKPHLYSTVGGETFETLIKRVGQTLSEIVSCDDDDESTSVLLVTHGVTKKAFYKIVKDIPLEQFWAPPHMHNTCLSILEVSKQGQRFILEADLSHLEV